MHIKYHILWVKMKYWQWRNGAPAPEQKVDMLLLRYGTEHKRHYSKNKLGPNNFETTNELMRELGRKHFAEQQQFDKFVDGLRRTATTVEGKTVLAEVYWILASSVSSWDYTLEGVKERRIWRQGLEPEIRRLGLNARIECGNARWHEHVLYWYKRLFNQQT